MLLTKETHQVQIFRLSIARMKISQIPCHFSSHKSVFTYILHHLSVSWHIISLKFSSWGITLWTKRAHESTNFQVFDCFNESSPNSSCQFWNHSVKVYSNFASMFSVMKDNSSVFFYLKPLYFWQKEPVKVKFSNFWVVGWKLPNTLCQVWNCTSVFFNFATLFSVMRDNSSVFFSWNCTWFGEKEPIKVQYSRLTTAHVKFHQTCTLMDSFSLVLIVYNVFIFDLKNYRGVIFHDTEEWCKAFGLENGMRNMANFHQSTWKC